MIIKADIHIHTCLSPCADIYNSPKRVVQKAYNAGLNMIFITDHNTVKNALAAIKASAGYEGCAVYPGMEITTQEEIHILGLFENMNDALNAETIITRNLPDTVNKKEYEEQVIANEFDEVEGYYKKSLFSAVNLNVDKIVSLIHNCNGLAIAAHIDRPSFSVLSQLGFIPEDMKFDALEISPNMTLEKAKDKYSEYYNKYGFVKGSDAHSLNLIGTSITEFEAEDNNFKRFADYLK
jgi:predicted metal-dependent phosphoesterase TrpH